MGNIDIVLPALINSDYSEEMTKKCIHQAYANASRANNFIVVENGEMPVLFDYSCDYVYTKKPRSYAQNVNTGLILSTAPYVVILNNDCFLPPNWDDNLLSLFNQPGCGIATMHSSEHGTSCKDEVVEDYFGAVWMVSRECLMKVGLLDECFKNSFEDADYWVRVYQAGFKIYKDNSIMCDHLVRRTCTNITDDKKSQNKNRELFNKKHSGCGLAIYERLK